MKTLNFIILFFLCNINLFGMPMNTQTSGLVKGFHFNTETIDFKGSTTVVIGSPALVTGKYGGGCEFVRVNNNGVGYSFVNCPTGNSPVSISWWQFYKSATAPTSGDEIAVGSMGDTSVNQMIAFITGNTDGEMRQVWFSAASYSAFFSTTGYLTWTHVAFTWGGASQKISYYVNGKLRKTVIHNNGLNILQRAEGGDVVGNYRFGSNNGFNGVLDEVYIWNKELTAGELKKLYYNNNKCSSGQ